jgi:hypothetical protein
LTWPEQQEDAVQLLLHLEAHEGALYHASDEAIEQGFAEYGERVEISWKP